MNMLLLYSHIGTHSGPQWPLNNCDSKMAQKKDGIIAMITFVFKHATSSGTISKFVSTAADIINITTTAQ